MYSEQVLDHFQNPRNAGDVADATAVAEITNPVCGDTIRLSVRVQDGRAMEAKFRAKGCVPAMACASLLAETVQGQTLAELRDINKETLLQRIGGLPPASQHAATMAVDALRAVLAKVKR